MLDAEVKSHLKATTGVELLTFDTANGHKPSIFLEELKAAYGLNYTVHRITLPKGEHKQPWYLSLNPNGQIPTIVAHDDEGGPLAIAECSAILTYLARTCDKDHKFSFTSSTDAAMMEQWLAFSQGDLSPAAIQCMRFYRRLPERHAFPTAYFHKQLRMCFDTMERHLKSQARDFLVGQGRGRYSVADVANFTMVDSSVYVGVGELGERWPTLEAWRRRIAEREAVRRGINVPTPNVSANDVYLEKFRSDVARREEHERLQGHLKKALEAFPNA